MPACRRPSTRQLASSSTRNGRDGIGRLYHRIGGGDGGATAGRMTPQSMPHARTVMPFTALVGQDSMKSALLLNAINPAIGGVLIRGERGTAKSTAVRALSRLLPEIDVVADCRYSCDPADPQRWCDECRSAAAAGTERTALRRRVRVVELPVNASEDRVVGSIDTEAAI